jgi:site-specific DNA-methyltransferase (adenine-specific)
MDFDKLTMLQGDCSEKLKELPNQCIDLIVTSPPYANQREGKYEGVPAEEYVAWFLPIARQLKRILKPSGSFFLNIKPHCEGGERLLYVADLIIALKREIGFSFIDEYCWYKSASPRRKSFRLKNAWEPVYHFALGKNFINHEAIKVKSNSTFANKRGTTSYDKRTGNVGGYHDIADQVPGFTDPDNILYFPTSLLVKDKFPHPAKFPRELVDFLIKGFCPDDGTVLDPFMGSGTVALSSLLLGRRCYGVELEPAFLEMTLERLRTYEPLLPDVTLEQIMLFDPADNVELRK